MKAADRRVWFAAPLVLLALAILLGLGTWQVKRLYWKEALLADIEERRNAAPATVAEIEAIAKSGGDIEYRKVSLSGTFDH
ncbi:MAG: SURF1 family protein, partial [Rhizobium pusense]|nr:SURF1 family protein [Agrobacterium pusense]